MSIECRKRKKRQRYDHGQPLLRASSLPFLIFFSCLAMVGLSLDRVPVHVLTIDLVTGPSQGWIGHPDIEVHSIVATQKGTIEWNGEKINMAALLRYLHAGRMQPVEPEIVFAPEANASYDLSAKVLAIIAASGVTKFCFGELERYKDFGKEASTYRLNLTLVDPEPRKEWSPPFMEIASMPPQCSNPFR